MIALSVSACGRGGSSQTAPSGESSLPDSASRTAAGRSKTPTPQLEFDSEKYPGYGEKPAVRPENPGNADDGVPRYPVDARPDPALDGYSDLSSLFAGLISAPGGVTPAEQGINLFDGFESSKYCVRSDGSVEVIWAMDVEVTVSAYELVTANDTADYPERNPAGWELYGSPDGSGDSWVPIDSVTDPGLPAGNYLCKGYIVKNPGRYRCFRLVMMPAIAGNYIQLSELRLYTSDPASAGLANGYSPVSLP